MTKYLAFDLEIARQLPPDETDWKAHRPLGITCAACFGTLISADWSDAPQLSQYRCQAIVRWLIEAQASYKIVTWNGLGFDFDILAEESGMWDECKELALNHVDMMFHLFCIRGHPLGLDKAAKGQGLEGKTEGMSGALVPELWAKGEYDQVLEYLREDVKITLDLAIEVEVQRELHWTSSSGKPQMCEFPFGWLTVKEAMELPLPDTSWMTDPWPREKFYGWTNA